MNKTSRAVIIDSNGLMVFYREKCVDGKKISYYAIPGGHVEDGESLEETVVRELREEFNIDIEVKRYLGKILVGDIEEYYYECEVVGVVPVLGGEELERNCSDNYYEFRYLPVDEIENSEIRAIDLIRKVV